MKLAEIVIIVLLAAFVAVVLSWFAFAAMMRFRMLRIVVLLERLDARDEDREAREKTKEDLLSDILREIDELRVAVERLDPTSRELD